MIWNWIHVIFFHFIIQSVYVERLGRVGKFSCQHGIHVDPAGRKTNMNVVALRKMVSFFSL